MIHLHASPARPTAGSHNLLRPHIAPVGGSGILTGFPSATALALTLGADSPCADERCAGNLGLSATGPFTLFIATHVSIRTSDISSSPLEPPSQTYGTLLHHPERSLHHAQQHTRTTHRGALPAVNKSPHLNAIEWIARDPQLRLSA